MGRASIFWMLCSMLACSVEPGGITTGITTYDPVSTTTPIPTTSTSTGTPESGDATETGATTSSTTSDHPSTSGPMPDFGGEGCDKIDVLYVLSQATPPEHRESIREGLQYFNERLIETFTPNVDLHLLVTDEMIEWPGDVCKEQCELEGHCDLTGDPDFPCDALKYAHPCEARCGAGHTFPIGVAAANRPCVSNNAQYLRSSSTLNLLETLDCTTQVGTFTGLLADNAPNTMMYAVTNDAPPVDGCNTGFIRDDAVLIVVFVSSDTTDQNDSIDPSQWAATLFDAKNGNTDAVGVIALISDQTLEDPVCQPAYDPNQPTETVQFVRDFMPHRVFGSICTGDTTSVFAGGIEMMQNLCEQYVPQ